MKVFVSIKESTGKKFLACPSAVVHKTERGANRWVEEQVKAYPNVSYVTTAHTVIEPTIGRPRSNKANGVSKPAPRAKRQPKTDEAAPTSAVA